VKPRWDRADRKWPAGMSWLMFMVSLEVTSSKRDASMGMKRKH